MASRIPYKFHIINIASNCHKSAKEIFSELKRDFPQVGQATVYRHIEQLVDEQSLSKIHERNGISYYEHILSPHMHIIDTDTGYIRDIEMRPIEGLSNYDISNVVILARPKHQEEKTFSFENNQYTTTI